MIENATIYKSRNKMTKNIKKTKKMVQYCKFNKLFDPRD